MEHNKTLADRMEYYKELAGGLRSIGKIERKLGRGFDWIHEDAADAIETLLETLKAVQKNSGLKLIKCEWDGCHLNIPAEYDGKWILVTDGKSFSVERYKLDAYDHFFPCGLFEAEETIAWMPLDGLRKMLKELYQN